MPEPSISFSWATLARKYPFSGVRSVPTMDSAIWCPTPAAASAARKLRPEVSKNSSTAWSSNEGEFARSITTCAPARAPLRPSPVIVLMPLAGEAAMTSWPRWRRMATVFEPIRPVPPMLTIFMIYPPLRRLETLCATLQRDGFQSQRGLLCQSPSYHMARGGSAGSSVYDAKAFRTMRASAEVFEIRLLRCATTRYRSDVDKRRSKRLVGAQFQHRTFDFVPSPRGRNAALGRFLAKLSPMSVPDYDLQSGLRTGSMVASSRSALPEPTSGGLRIMLRERRRLTR